MKIRLTPLNIVSALCLVASVLMLMQKRSNMHIDGRDVFSGLFVLVAVVAFISDLLFRRLVPSLRKLWVIEVMVVVLIIIVMYILIAGIK